MAFRCRVNGPVEGRRQSRNPCTTNGFPRLGTYDGLGIMSTNRQASRASNIVKTKGGKSHVHTKPRLARQNLLHRMKGVNLNAEHERRTADKLLIKARRLTYWLQTCRTKMIPVLMREYEAVVREMVTLGAANHVQDLIRTEDGLGQIRGRITARRAGMTL